jgi:hypothetical protein
MPTTMSSRGETTLKSRTVAGSCAWVTRLAADSKAATTDAMYRPAAAWRRMRFLNMGVL